MIPEEDDKTTIHFHNLLHSAADLVNGDLPKRIWCWDCEKCYDDVKDFPCAGQRGLGLPDNSMPDEAWEDVYHPFAFN